MVIIRVLGQGRSYFPLICSVADAQVVSLRFALAGIPSMGFADNS